MADRYVLCRRDIGEIGTREFCGKPIKTLSKELNRLDWCDDCRKILPIWPTEVAA